MNLQKIIRTYRVLLYTLPVVFPTIALAFPGDLRGFSDLVLQTIDIINPILIGIAFLVFFWGIAKFILSAGNEKELANGRQFMVWGVIGLFILISISGILRFLSNQFEFTPGASHFLPE